VLVRACGFKSHRGHVIAFNLPQNPAKLRFYGVFIFPIYQNQSFIRNALGVEFGVPII